MVQATLLTHPCAHPCACASNSLLASRRTWCGSWSWCWTRNGRWRRCWTWLWPNCSVREALAVVHASLQSWTWIATCIHWSRIRLTVPILPARVCIRYSLSPKLFELVHVLCVDCTCESAIIKNAPAILRSAWRAHVSFRPRPICLSVTAWVAVSALAGNSPGSEGSKCGDIFQRILLESSKVGLVVEPKLVTFKLRGVTLSAFDPCLSRGKAEILDHVVTSHHNTFLTI